MNKFTGFIMNAKDIVCNLVKKYETRNPYNLVKELGIILQYGEDMGNVRGFYLYANRIKLICLGNDMPEPMERFVLAHEIGHCIMHKQSSAPFLQSTLITTDKYELEANKFAAELIIDDDELKEYSYFTVDQWSMYYGLPREIIELKLGK